mgnify:CR=1 FL=1
MSFSVKQVVTCKLNGVDPENNFRHVLDSIADWPFTQVSERLSLCVVCQFNNSSLSIRFSLHTYDTLNFYIIKF